MLLYWCLVFSGFFAAFWWFYLPHLSLGPTGWVDKKKIAPCYSYYEFFVPVNLAIFKFFLIVCSLKGKLTKVRIWADWAEILSWLKGFWNIIAQMLTMVIKWVTCDHSSKVKAPLHRSKIKKESSCNDLKNPEISYNKFYMLSTVILKFGFSFVDLQDG